MVVGLRRQNRLDRRDLVRGTLNSRFRQPPSSPPPPPSGSIQVSCSGFNVHLRCQATHRSQLGFLTRYMGSNSLFTVSWAFQPFGPMNSCIGFPKPSSPPQLCWRPCFRIFSFVRIFRWHSSIGDTLFHQSCRSAIVHGCMIGPFNNFSALRD